MSQIRKLSPQAMKEWEDLKTVEQACQWHKLYTPWWQVSTIEKMCNLYPHLINLTEKKMTEQYQNICSEFENLLKKSI